MYLARVPGWKFSTKTSEPDASRFKVSRSVAGEIWIWSTKVKSMKAVTFLVLEVQCDALLVPVDGQVIAGLSSSVPLHEGRTPSPNVVPNI